MSSAHIRVMVYFWCDRDGDREVWRGECVTLNLVTERPTFDAALHAMQDQIGSYVDVALQGDPAGLIPRYSPWTRRLHHWCAHKLPRWFRSREVYRHEEPLPQAC